ncbi:MAG: ABC transporter permease, partial [Acidimicrobiales bacterium]
MLIRWIGARVAAALATLALLSVAVFVATEVLPGDAVGVVSGPQATEAERAEVRSRLGLDRPAPVRYLQWLGSAATGDLGTSLVSDREVTDIVRSRLTAGSAVFIPAAVLLTVLAGGLGIVAGLNPGRWPDRMLSASAVGLIAVPDFLLAAALLVVFTTWWRVLPAVAIVPVGESLWAHPELIVLPVAALALGGFGPAMRLLRASVADATETPYAEFARLNGVRGLRYARIVVGNALGPATQALAIILAGLLGGAVVVETLFNLPGLGQELTQAVASRDVPLVQGLALVLGGVTLTILLAGDVIARLLGPAGRSWWAHAGWPSRPPGWSTPPPFSVPGSVPGVAPHPSPAPTHRRPRSANSERTY